MKELKTTMRIESISRIKTQTKNKEKEMWRVQGKDTNGVETVVFNTPQNPDGIKPNEVVDIIIRTSQMSLNDFEAKAEAAKPKKIESKEKA